MNRILYLLLILIALTNCSAKKVVKHHGISSLVKKTDSLIINQSNKNDIQKIIGYPSTISKFDNNIWIYIERKQTQSSIKNLGKLELYKNDILVLEIDDLGVLRKKKLYNLDNMNNDIMIVKEITDSTYRGNSFIYEFMSSMRAKINDPLGVRAKKRKKIIQR